MTRKYKEIPSEKTDFGPGKTALYYKNAGLFSDTFIEDRLNKIEESDHPVSDFLNKHWNSDMFDSDNFENALNKILNDWDRMGEDVGKFCDNEAQLEEHWIKPIFKLLGWTYEVQDKIEKRGKKQWPDYSLFADQGSRKKSKETSSLKKFNHALSVADAKAWGISLDGTGFTNSNPSFQIVTYMEMTKKDWGILTNGKDWRIYSLKPDSKHTTYFEVDLIKILSTKDPERFKFFYNFFRKDSFVKRSSIADRCFLDVVFEEGKFYSKKVERKLKTRAYNVVEIISKGFAVDVKPSNKEELEYVYEHSLFYLFRLMFILNCESRGLLEVDKQDDYYEYSLRKICMDLRDQLEMGKKWSDHSTTYNKINSLFELLSKGDASIGVHGFGNNMFDGGDPKFFNKYKLSDKALHKALLELACDLDDEGEYIFIDYKILSPDHIGSIFEGLLEFQLVKKNSKLELLNDKGKKKNTGSYYTPDVIVDYVSEKVYVHYGEEITSKSIKSFKVCDPSMGSGHFLLGAIKLLELKLQEWQNNNPDDNENIDFKNIKKFIVENCIFGMDINNLAVELTKFSIWINTAQKGEKLLNLEGSFKCGNTLLVEKIEDELVGLPKKFKGFDLILGNPPYFGEQGHKKDFDLLKESSIYKNVYKRHMDYFYFFIGKGIQFLKDGGYLGYITTSYWEQADSSSNLKDYIFKNGYLREFIDFKDEIIFENAKGQHNAVFSISKGGTGETLRLVGEIDREKNIVLEKKDKAKRTLSRNNDFVTIDKYFYVKQGIVTGADKVSNKNIDRINSKFQNDVNLGDGIFVITIEELNSLKLSAKEMKVVKPLYTARNIPSDGIDTQTDKYIIISNLIKNINDYPKIKNHLEKFRGILESRSQMEHCLDWWDLHQLRLKDKSKSGQIKDYFFDKGKIVYVSLSEVPSFQYYEDEFYCTGGGLGGIYYIYSKDYDDVKSQKLAEYLNSDEFFDRIKSGEISAQYKGKQINFSGSFLKKITVPKWIIEEESLKKAA